MKKQKWLILFLIFLFPFSIFAYSNKIAIGGETIGIEIHSNGVYIVGFYEVNGHKIAEEAGFRIGDIIQEIDHVKIDDLKDLNEQIQEDKVYSFTVLRGQSKKNISLKLEMENRKHFQTGIKSLH